MVSEINFICITYPVCLKHPDNIRLEIIHHSPNVEIRSEKKSINGFFIHSTNFLQPSNKVIDRSIQLRGVL